MAQPATSTKMELDIAKIFDLLEDLKDAVDVVQENLEEAKKDLNEEIRKVLSHQKGILEPNQQTIYKELKKLQGQPAEEEAEEG
jgi:gas vesicle protein